VYGLSAAKVPRYVTIRACARKPIASHPALPPTEGGREGEREGGCSVTPSFPSTLDPAISNPPPPRITARARTHARFCASVRSENETNFPFRVGHFVGASLYDNELRRVGGAGLGESTCAKIEKITRALFFRSARGRKKGEKSKPEWDPNRRLIHGESSFVGRLLPPDERRYSRVIRETQLCEWERRKGLKYSCSRVIDGLKRYRDLPRPFARVDAPRASN